MARYRVFREHKLVTHYLSDFQRFVGKADFRKNEAVAEVKKQLGDIVGLMAMHADNEDKRIHQFFRDKGSQVQVQVEKDHEKHAGLFANFNTQLDTIQASTDNDQREDLGYIFYLAVRKFEGENLMHLHEEETVLMPELQRLYTDDELRQIDAPSYQIMTADQMTHMLKALFPYYNAQDRRAFLGDIQHLQPEKFLEAWKGIESSIAEDERAELIIFLKINVNSVDYQRAQAATANIRYGWEQGKGDVIITTSESDRAAAAASTGSQHHSPVSKASFLAPKQALPTGVSDSSTPTNSFRPS